MNQVRLVFGTKGSGKSFSVKRDLDRLPARRALIVWDPVREYAGEGARDGIRRVTAVFRSWPAFLEAQAAAPRHLGRVVLQLGPDRFPSLCRWALAAGGLTVVLDELHLAVGRGSPPANERALRDLLYLSRHRQVDVVALAWRPTELPPFLRHAWDELRAFQTSEVNDLKWYSGTVGQDFADNLPGLPARKSLTAHKGRT